MVDATTDLVITAEDAEIIKGILYALRSIKGETGHGVIQIAISDNKISDMEITHKIRPHIFCPWAKPKPLPFVALSKG